MSASPHDWIQATAVVASCFGAAALAASAGREWLAAFLSMAGLALIGLIDDTRLSLTALELAIVPALLAATAGPAAAKRRIAALAPWAASLIPLAAWIVFAPCAAANARLSAPIASVALACLLFRLGAAPFSSIPAGTMSCSRPQAAGLAAAATPVAVWLLTSRMLPSISGAMGNDAVVLILASVAPVTVALCSLAALHHRNVCRCAAWMAVAQSGFLTLSLACGADGSRAHELGAVSGIPLMMSHGFAVGGIYAALSVFPCRREDPDTLEDWAGLASKRPVLAASASIAFLSAAGVPPLAGFTGRINLACAAAASGSAVIAISALASLAAAIPLVYCGFRIVGYAYFRKPVSSRIEPESSGTMTAIAAACAAASVIFGFFPFPFGMTWRP